MAGTCQEYSFSFFASLWAVKCSEYWRPIVSLRSYVIFDNMVTENLFHLIDQSYKQTHGKSILQVPDTGMSQYWWILEHFWCTSIAWKCDILRSLERAGVIQNLTILERKNGLVLSNTRVPVSGTWSILFPRYLILQILVIFPTKYTVTVKQSKEYYIKKNKTNIILYFLLLFSHNTKTTIRKYIIMFISFYYSLSIHPTVMSWRSIICGSPFEFGIFSTCKSSTCMSVSFGYLTSNCNKDKAR